MPQTSTTQFNLVSKLEVMRTEYQTYIAELMKVNALVRDTISLQNYTMIA